MLSSAITSIIVIASVLQTSLPEAVRQHVYTVPTITSGSAQQSEPVTQTASDFEWRILQRLYGKQEIPAPTKKSQNVDPVVAARAAIIVDGESKHVLWQKNPDAVLPFASITKLASALVWLDHQPSDGFNHIHTFAPEEDQPDGKELNLPHGTQLNTLNLLNGSIVGSNNDMIVALAHTTAIPDAQYIELMNKKAKALQMEQTQFADITGLSDKNVGTVGDIAKLARAAFDAPEIAAPAGQATHLQETPDKKFTNRMSTTNKLLYDKDLQVVAGKTGFTYAAGYCVVVKILVPKSAGGDGKKYVIAVVLGTSSDNDRFVQAKKLAQWSFTEFDWSAQ